MKWIKLDPDDKATWPPMGEDGFIGGNREMVRGTHYWHTESLRLVWYTHWMPYPKKPRKDK